mgnify:CR=1 FL=1
MALNAIISTGRALWYRHEAVRLRFERLRALPPHLPHALVSVIIPTHNRVDLLFDRALPSAQRQSYDNLEIIVAAHGCTDNTVAAVQAHAHERRTYGDRRLRIVVVPRVVTYPPTRENHWFAGPVDPLNAALKVCRGGWIARLDDDDEWTVDHIESLLTFASCHDFEFVSSAHRTHMGLVSPYDVDGVEVGGCQTWLYRSYLRFMRYNPDCWRKRWNRVNDTDLQARFRAAGVRMGYLPEVTAVVLPRPGKRSVGLAAYFE